VDVIYTHCASIDVHKKIAVCCCCTPEPDGAPSYTTRTFGTMTTDILDLAAWLTSLDIVHIVMESTGESWKPFYNLLEATFTVLVVNAQHIKNVPGRKTDVMERFPSAGHLASWAKVSPGNNESAGRQTFRCLARMAPPATAAICVLLKRIMYSPWPIYGPQFGPDGRRKAAAGYLAANLVGHKRHLRLHQTKYCTEHWAPCAPCYCWGLWSTLTSVPYTRPPPESGRGSRT
jgi:hypothetical protein